MSGPNHLGKSEGLDDSKFLHLMCTADNFNQVCVAPTYPHN